MTKKRATIVVLGDIGHSPRMGYHAMSISKEGYQVDILGYEGSSPHLDLLFDPNITLHHLKKVPQCISAFPRILYFFLKVVWQSWILFYNLLSTPKSDFILIQNPPSIPTIPVCWLVSNLRRIPLVIDWHNYGYSILALNLGPNHPLVKISRFLEETLGRKSKLNFCVTEAMSVDLKENWGIEAVTLYDRPAEMFQPIELREKHEFLVKLGKSFPMFSSPTKPDVCTVMTEITENNQVCLRKGSPGFLVSSTSWTEDEDFSILLSALDEYEVTRETNQSEYPPLMCVITGKGPLKEYYLEIIKSKQWKHVIVCTPWLQAEDYPKLIACADLGVCLHTSSSGLDLPMKVVDMFGCGLPVCAINYNCLAELVRHNENGLVFDSAEMLTAHLLDWFHNYPNSKSQHQVFRENLLSFQNVRWHSAWLTTAWPHLSNISF